MTTEISVMYGSEKVKRDLYIAVKILMAQHLWLNTFHDGYDAWFDQLKTCLTLSVRGPSFYVFLPEPLREGRIFFNQLEYQRVRV